ncbi:MAG: tRNA uridine-5-carboxymethylaminomethyl(34) synthesis enzyme MnmG [Planctomycetes bacterium]|nr:tRNA uridine-5-carboxymethylaminomethyl(34) synthesis enzyme MnmG [Planctomycetota bacterium]
MIQEVDETRTTVRRPDAVVVGGGHAGVEAARALALMGQSCLLVSLRRDALGRMSCNPSIGGLAKGQLVRELDALGGLMGMIADRSALQFRLLNASKGPAVRSPRCQSDNVDYNARVVAELENTPGLEILEDEVVELIAEDGRIVGVDCARVGRIETRVVVLTTGTFLGGRLHVGDAVEIGGRVDEPAAHRLSASLLRHGFRLGRLKTGTPPRLHRDSIDFARMELQEGDASPTTFSYLPQPIIDRQIPCHITRTGPRTHAIIAANLERSAMYSGSISGRGPRYCPSIEDKIHRFAGRDSHQVFIEPESRSTPIYYPNGISTSLPAEVQEAFVRSIPGLEEVEILRHGYAVEYDYVDPTELDSRLMTRRLAGLFHAGQLNGTTGYEEAAAQGFMAGANAALWLRGEEPLVLGRHEAYIGVLIDDLVTRGVQEPYRMFTSLAEHRLLLRHDNADLRLAAAARRLGIAGPERLERSGTKRELLDRGRRLVAGRQRDGRTLDRLLRRQDARLDDHRDLLPELYEAPWDVEIRTLLETEVRYQGYVERQHELVAKMRKAETMAIPAELDYARVPQLRAEAREKLSAIRPRTIGQAARISGISQPDLSLVMIAIRRLEAGGSGETGRG